MKKRFIKACAALGVAAMLAGCGTTVSGKKEETLSVSISDMANELKSGLTFEDSLSELDQSVALSCYGIDAADVTDSVVMVSTGATAEEIAVFEAADADAADAIKTACDSRKEKQTTSYADYKPAETSRLDKAIIRQDGNYVVYLVADDTDKANEIISSYFK